MYQFSYAEVLDETPKGARERERQAIDRSIELLREAEAQGVRSRAAIEAILFVRRLWGYLIEDLARPDNDLPQKLRADLISIGLWMMREAEQIQTRGLQQLQGADRRIDRHPRRPRIVRHQDRPETSHASPIHHEQHDPILNHDFDSRDGREQEYARLQYVPAAADRGDEEPGPDQADGLRAVHRPARLLLQRRAGGQDQRQARRHDVVPGADAGGGLHRPHR